MSELLEGGPDLGEDATLEAAHVEEKVWVVLAVDGHEARLPLDGGDGARQAVLNIPEHRPTQVDVMLHQPHASISRPTLLVVIADYVLVVWVRVLRQIPLDQVPGFFCSEPTTTPP